MQNETKRRTTPIDIHISELNDAKFIGKRIRVDALINDLEEIPFVPPEVIEMECSADPDNQAMCRSCSYSSSASTTKVLSAEDAGLLKFINCKDDDLWRLYKQVLHIPSKCNRSNFKETSKINMSQGSLVPTVDYIETSDDGIQDENSYNILIETVFIGKDLVQSNRSYRIEGIPHRDPKNGKLVFLADKSEGIMDDISNFKLTDGMKEALKIFQPKDDSKEALQEKLSDIHNEMRINHHKIHGRENVAFFMDLAYHSVMGFEWGADTHLRGWLQLCICGDTSVGKSEMVERIMQMHQMGYTVPGESVSYAGLMGGVVNQNNRRSGNILHWGILPKHHKRIVIFDEAHNKNATDIWPMLNDVNSSGIAKYNKIIQRQAPAMVRKIFISNPPEGSTVNDYLHPCEMLKQIYSTPETIRRMDALVVPTMLEVDPSLISKEEPNIEPKYYSHWGYPGEHAYKYKSPGYWLLRFIYSRGPKQVIFTEEARQLILKESDRLCKKYTSMGIPLVEPGSIRFKLARGAAPIAARTFSVDGTFETIKVYKRHVEVYIEALEDQYDGATGYLGYSKKMDKTTRFENDEDFYKICVNVKKAFQNESNKGLLEKIYEENYINFKELGFIWDCTQDVIKGISTAMMTYGLVTANKSMTNFRKNRKGLMVLGYLRKINLSGLIAEADCISYYKKNT